jgi:AsmA protein
MNLMGRFFKYLSITVAALLGLLLIGVVVFALLFDPNDYRERIAAEVKAFSGRELKIEGDLGINFFPWLAIEVGRAELGNAAGFGPEPFASFDAARLNVRLMPLLLRREVLIGTAELNGLALNLAVDKSGRSNWQDLVDAAGDTGADEAATEDAASPAALDIGGIRFDDASLVYEDAALGERYELREFDVATGAVQSGEPIGVKGSFSFASMPAAQSGDMTFSAVVSLPDAAGIVVLSELALEGSVNGLVEDVAATPVALRAPVIRLDTEAEVVDTGELGIEVFGLDIAAEVEPFSYAAELEPVAMLKIAPFAPRELMQALKIDAPVTADPKALGKLTIEGRASMTNERVAFSGLTLVLDDTTFTGELSAPLGEKGSYRMALAGDRIDLDRYMAPADDAASSDASADEAPIEIPVEIIKTIQAEGKLTLQSVLFAGLEFSDVTVGINNTNGKLRINPFTAAFFDGSYQGDIRIDATGAVAVVSANEKVQDVSLAPLAKAMLDEDNITGRLNGTFALNGRGNNSDAIMQSLAGNVSFTLKDGAYEGTDLWYELRRARSLLKQEPPPELKLPARTPFSNVSATGKITDGVMQNEDLLAELPFMRMQGKGKVELVTSKIDYSVSARVFERPEFVTDATPEEISDLSKVVIPLRITGTLSAPKVGVDIADAVKERVVDDLKNRILKELEKGEEPAPEGEEKEKDAGDILKDKLKDLLGR